jgi:hypothetical protein
MRYLLLLLITTSVVNVTSCRETKKTATIPAATDSSKTGEMKIMIPDTYCYSTTGSKDSLYLKLEKFPNVVAGKLIYKLYEKDTNTGDIDGVLHGDTLIADYNFLSEGKNSVRQVIFLIKDNTAREGYGQMEDHNGKMVFKNLQQIDFTKGVLLHKIDCPIH